MPLYLNLVQISKFLLFSLLVTCYLLLASPALAAGATFSINPGTGKFALGQTIKAQVQLNANGNEVNAGEGDIQFTTDTLKLVGISKGNLFTFWQTEPKENSGTIRFVGGRNSNYSSSGTLFTLNFQTLKEGPAKVTFTSGRILAADGEGTLKYGGSSSANWSIGSTQIPAGNKPEAPIIKSSTHPEQSHWYNNKTASFSWEVPANVNQTATAIDTNPNTEPTKFENPQNHLETDTSEGIYYLHVKFKNKFGSSATTHYKFQSDLTPPENFTLRYPQSQETTKHNPRIGFSANDKLSGIHKYTLSLDNQPAKTLNLNNDSEIEFSSLPIGRHNFEAKAYDQAGNVTSAKSYIIVEPKPFPWSLILSLLALLVSLLSLLLNINNEKFPRRKNKKILGK